MRVYARIMDLTTECACTAIRRAARGITECYDRILAPSGLLSTQFSLLRNIERIGTANISTLAKAVQLDRTTLGRNLRVLEAAELVVLSTDIDQRARTIQLTRKGKNALKTAFPLWTIAQEQVRDLLSKVERDTLFAAVERIAAWER